MSRHYFNTVNFKSIHPKLCIITMLYSSKLLHAWAFLLHVWTLLPLSTHMSISACMHLSMKSLYFEHHFASQHSEFLLFEQASSLFLWHNLAHFGIPYLCPLNPCKSRPSEGNITLWRLSLDPGHKHFYRWHVCNILFNYVYIKSDCIHFANGSEQCAELHILRHQVAQ